MSEAEKRFHEHNAREFELQARADRLKSEWMVLAIKAEGYAREAAMASDAGLDWETPGRLHAEIEERLEALAQEIEEVEAELERECNETEAALEDWRAGR